MSLYAQGILSFGTARIECNEPDGRYLVVYALGSVSFLLDKGQTPYMHADELSERFGVSLTTTHDAAP